MHAQALPADWLLLVGTIFLLGARHGLDADHLAAIDGMTRHNISRSSRLAPWCGLLFSAGHGLVVMAIALTVGFLGMELHAPDWLDAVGSLVSIFFLIAIGSINLISAVKTAPGDQVALRGLKTFFYGKSSRTSDPLAIAMVGALFAFSFDTITQAAFFAFFATKHGGISQALIIGFCFCFGMLLVDGINGVFISKLLQTAESIASRASRVMAYVVSLLSFSVAGFGIAKIFFPRFSGAAGPYQLVIGASTIGIVLAAFLCCLCFNKTRSEVR